jgi:hypothetical protein
MTNKALSSQEGLYTKNSHDGAYHVGAAIRMAYLFSRAQKSFGVNFD